jgi:hypothetical protein
MPVTVSWWSGHALGSAVVCADAGEAMPQRRSSRIHRTRVVLVSRLITSVCPVGSCLASKKRPAGFSVERLTNLLTAVDEDVEIVIRN